MLKSLNMEFPPNKLRQIVLTMAKNGASVHIACAFSLIEIVSVIYGKFAKLDLSEPQHPDRDIVALSKGHGIMAFYACFRLMGWVQEQDIEAYFSDGSRLKGLADCHFPGVDVTGGSLGHGLTVAVGMALAAKFQSNPKTIFCIVGDGEMNEGCIWESLLFAAHWKLDNLVVIVDANGHQAMGRSTDILSCEPISDKLRSFNFSTWEIDGHDVVQIDHTLEAAIYAKEDGHPKAIIARTVKGKGISFMEDDNSWHYTRLDDKSFQKAMEEVR